MIHKTFGIFKLLHLFNFCDISATFIVIYCMAFTEDLFVIHVIIHIEYSYYSCIQGPWLPASFRSTRHQKLCLLFPQMSSWAPVPYDPPHCTVEMEILTFFLRLSVACAGITPERVTPGETEQQILPMYIISVFSPLRPKIQQFLHGSCFIPGDITKLPAPCQMLDVF